MSKDNTNRTSVEKATEDFNELLSFAKEGLLNEMKSQLETLVEKAIKESSEEDGEVIEEAIKVETDKVSVEVSDNGEVKVEEKGSSEGSDLDTMDDEIDPIDDSVELASDMSDTTGSDEFDIEPSEEEPIELDDTQDELEEIEIIDEDDMYEQEEQQPAQEAPVQEDPTTLLQRALELMIDQAISEQGGEAPVDGQEDPGVDIVDDEAGAEAAPAAPAPAPQQEPAQDQPLAEDDEIIELEIEEDYDDELEEMKMHGASHSVQRTAGRSAGPEAAVSNRSRYNNLQESIKKQKTHYEAKIAELVKENKGLKSELKEFKKSFIEFREQFNEMENFNAKLSLAYKTVTNNELTEGEKVEIVEKIEEVSSIEEATKVYQKMINEKKNPKKETKVIKSSAIPVVQPKKPLYESDEVKRMKKLGGITKNDPDSLIA